MLPVTRILVVIHVVCRYRLIALLPAHPLRNLLLVMSFLLPSSWLGTGKLSEGGRPRPWACCQSRGRPHQRAG